MTGVMHGALSEGLCNMHNVFAAQRAVQYYPFI